MIPKRCSIALGVLVALAVAPPLLKAQNAALQAGRSSKRVIVMLEPNTISFPQSSVNVEAAAATFRVAKVRDVFSRTGVKSIRRASPRWNEIRQANPQFRVHTPRKNRRGPVPPDALMDMSNLYVLELPDDADVAKVVAQLNAAEGVVFAEPDALEMGRLTDRNHGAVLSPTTGTRFVTTPNDPLFEGNYEHILHGDWSSNTTTAWDYQTGILAAKVGIIEAGGFRHNHPDIGISRITQYDFLHDDGDAWPDAGYDDQGHGTEVTGTAAAKTNNNLHVSGICGGFGVGDGCSLFLAKTGTSQGNIIDALDWMFTNGVPIINNSFCIDPNIFGGASWSLFNAYRNSHMLGALNVAGMGNVGQCDAENQNAEVYPAGWRQITFGVGGSNVDGTLNSISLKRGNVIAPMSYCTISLPALENCTAFGTSIAAPHVSGIAGLLLSESIDRGLNMTMWDIRQLIMYTARQNTQYHPPGYNDETGYGVVDAAAAMQALQSPAQRNVGTVAPGAGCYNTTIQSTAFLYSQFIGANAQKCEVRVAVTFANYYPTPPLVWGTPVTNGGFSSDYGNSEVTYTEVIPGTVTSTGATLRSFVYWVNYNGQNFWHPYAPEQVAFAYTVLGTVGSPPPFTVTATAPEFVTVKTTYPLTGSANEAATDWLWERSYDGGPYGFWSNSQNSAFVAYGGQYTLGWRLSAKRAIDVSRDTAWATTVVCIPFVPSCYAVRAADAASGTVPTTARASNVAADHFGSGLWMNVPNAAQPLIRMYDFGGRHDQSTTTVPWPNILERDGGDWTFPLSGGALTIATQRHAAGENRVLLRVTGRLTGVTPARLALGLAADPDLGDPSDDALGFDNELGVVWVKDSATGRHLGYMALAAADARVRQFGLGENDAPESAADALRVMGEPTRVATGRQGDVRFVLSGPDLAVRDGRFIATYAVLSATSEADLIDLARATRKDAATLAASIPDQPTGAAPVAFGLRQSLGQAGLALSLAGGSATAVAQLQANGLTALDYSVPTGRAVTVKIRVYNSRGQLVRTLVDDAVPEGYHHVDWDKRNDRGDLVAPGVYVAVMEAGSFRATRKLVVTR